MKILVLNCGSSSIKYQLLEMENANSSRLLAKGLLERIGLEMGEFTHKYNGEKYYESTKDKAVRQGTMPIPPRQRQS